MAARKIILYKNYFKDFLAGLDAKTKKKVFQVLLWIQSIDIVPISLMKSIEGV